MPAGHLDKPLPPCMPAPLRLLHTRFRAAKTPTPTPPLQNNRGTVVKDGLGWAAGQLVTLDLQQLGVSPGWHQLVVQGKATDPRSRLTQTGERQGGARAPGGQGRGALCRPESGARAEGAAAASTST